MFKKQEISLESNLKQDLIHANNDLRTTHASVEYHTAMLAMLKVRRDRITNQLKELQNDKT